MQPFLPFVIWNVLASTLFLTERYDGRVTPTASSQHWMGWILITLLWLWVAQAAPTLCHGLSVRFVAYTRWKYATWNFSDVTQISVLRSLYQGPLRLLNRRRMTITVMRKP